MISVWMRFTGLADFIFHLHQFEFLQNALITGILASLACGVIGSYVVTRRITYIAGAIGHCVLGGMGAARYLEVVHQWNWLHPLHGAAVAALVSALIISTATIRRSQREDTLVSAIWAIGMAIGIMFIFKTPGYGEDLMSYLFGNILMVSGKDLWIVAGLDALIMIVVIFFYNQILSICFDEEFARLRGIRIEYYYTVLICLTALTVVLLVTVVGIVMVIALLTLPAAIANFFLKTLWKVMMLASFLTLFFTSSGLIISYSFDFPVGAATVLLTGAFYLFASPLARTLRRMSAKSGRAS